jgi:hypothetical protein
MYNTNDREVRECPHSFVSSRPQSRSPTNSDITPGCPVLHVPHMLVSTWSFRHLVPGEGWDDRKCPHPFLSVRHPPDRQWLGQQHWVNSSRPGLQNHHFHRRYLYDRYNFHSSILSIVSEVSLHEGTTDLNNKNYCQTLSQFHNHDYDLCVRTDQLSVLVIVTEIQQTLTQVIFSDRDHSCTR